MKFRIAGPISCLFLSLSLTNTINQLEAATIIRVPADQPTIQSAIAAAADGDTVLVSAGTYLENLDFLGKAIRVTSEQGPDVTIIDGNGANSVVTFATGEGRQSVLNGFTVRNGRTSNQDGTGGGIHIVRSWPTVTGNVITNNSAQNGGGGIGINFAAPLIQGNVIKNNGQTTGFSGGIGGGGISILGDSSAQILNNDISNNSWRSASGGGLSLIEAGIPTIQNNVVSHNTASSQGGGFFIGNRSDPLIAQNLIVGNTANTGGGVYWLVPFGSRGPLLISNTIYANLGSQGSGVFADGSDTQSELRNNIIVATGPGQTAVACGNFASTIPIFRNNDVISISGTPYGGTCGNPTGSNGNISADPLFVNTFSGDYHLKSTSPAIDAGTNESAPPADFSGVSRPMDGNGDGTSVIDIGAFEASTVDLTNPVTIATMSPSPNIAGWNTSSVTITLNAKDIAGGAGVQSITYSSAGVQASAPVTAGNPAVFTINAEGTTTVSYAATSNAGNIEPTKTLTIKIDRTAPVTTVTAMPASGASDWTSSSFTLTLNATDAAGGSGLQNITYHALNLGNSLSTVIAGSPVDIGNFFEGITNVTYAASDVAGNVEQPRVAAVKTDRTPPMIGGLPVDGCILYPPKHQMVQAASVTATDPLSGVASLIVTATSSEPDSGTGGGDDPGDIVINGGTVLLRAERAPNGQGRTYTIVAAATDLVGNTTTATATCTVPKDIDPVK